MVDDVLAYAVENIAEGLQELVGRGMIFLKIVEDLLWRFLWIDLGGDPGYLMGTANEAIWPLPAPPEPIN